MNIKILWLTLIIGSLIGFSQIGCDEEASSGDDTETGSDTDTDTDTDTDSDSDGDEDTDEWVDTDTECSEIVWGDDLFQEGGIFPLLTFSGFVDSDGDNMYDNEEVTFDSCDLHLTGPGCLVILYGADW